MSDQLTRSIELVRRAKHGEKDALDRLMQRYYERVRKIVRLRLGARLRSALESGDILQETFMAAAHKIDDFEPHDEGSLINWLAKLAERKITDAAGFHRAKKRDLHKRVPLQAGGADQSTVDSVADPADRAPSPAEMAQQTEEAKLVEACLHQLPETYRELIILRNYAGSSWAAIARETGRPTEAAARMMHAKAMIELSKLMRRRLPGDPGR